MKQTKAEQYESLRLLRVKNECGPNIGQLANYRGVWYRFTGITGWVKV